MTTAIQVKRMQRDEIGESGAVLARAFDDDPMMTYILPNPATRAKPALWMFTAMAKYGDKFGEAYTTASSVEGDAIWMPPGQAKVSPWRMAQVGMLAAPLKFGMGAFRRFLTVVNHVEHLHERDMAAPHWYLMVLGVDPPRQGQGVGGALIAPKLAQADAENLPCYLETMKSRNVTFYEKHGFEIVHEGDVPKGGPHFWTMKRMPGGNR
jgi:GNAT superfamily N-acetyltransferase